MHHAFRALAASTVGFPTDPFPRRSMAKYDRAVLANGFTLGALQKALHLSGAQVQRQYEVDRKGGVLHMGHHAHLAAACPIEL